MTSRRRRALLALGAIAAVAVALGVIVVTGVTASGGGPKRTPTVSGAATVQRRDLVATDTESGTLGYADPQTVYNRLTGTITWLPSVGQVVDPGGTLFRIDDAPIVLFDGSTPAYRALGPGVGDGPDVRELNRDLRRMGFDPYGEITVDDAWQTATTDAVERWQASLGERETGAIALGEIAFLPGAQRITAVDGVLGSTGQGADYIPGAARTTFIALHGAPASAPSAPAAPSRAPAAGGGDNAAILSALEALLRAQAAKASGNANDNNSGNGGDASGGTPAQAILQTASTRLVVTVALEATNESEAVIGEGVTVELPDGTLVNGRVTQVNPVSDGAGGSPAGAGAATNGNGGGNGDDNGNDNGGGSPPTIPVTVVLTGRLPADDAGLDQATVSVNFVQQRATNVLAVPVTALLATQGGGYAVQEAAPPHELLHVTPGLFTAGYVQVSGAGLYPGLQVTDAQG